MLKRLKQIRFLVLIILIAAAIIGVVGYIFAEKRSEPVYLSKIDRLMFEHQNKSPKFVLTLPDKKFVKKALPQKKKEVPVKNDMTNQELVEKFLMSIPMLAMIPERTDLHSSKEIELNSDLVEEKDGLQLPKIAANGRKPWFEYGTRENVQPNFYRVAVVINNVGFDNMATGQIIKAFPSEISLAFTPYAQNLKQNIIEARKNGHETYMDMLLPSADVLKSDTGPMAMSLTISAAENLARIQKAIAPGAPIGGVVVNEGIADEDNLEHVVMILEDLRDRGLLMLDATHSEGINKIKIEGLARNKAQVIIDEGYEKELIQQKFLEAEEIAHDKGYVLVVVNTKPIVLSLLNDWINTFSPQLDYEQLKQPGQIIEKPFALVPVSNIVVE